MAALRSHGEVSAAVTEGAFRAIENLSDGNDANKLRLGDAGACQGMLTVLPGAFLFSFRLYGLHSAFCFVPCLLDD